jgi:hypothetical protein
MGGRAGTRRIVQALIRGSAQEMRFEPYFQRTGAAPRRLIDGWFLVGAACIVDLARGPAPARRDRSPSV